MKSDQNIYTKDIKLQQWRSEGNWRPGAKLNFAPPPPSKNFSK